MLADLLLAIVDLGHRGLSGGRDQQGCIDARQQGQHVIAGTHGRQVEQDDVRRELGVDEIEQVPWRARLQQLGRLADVTAAQGNGQPRRDL